VDIWVAGLSFHIFYGIPDGKLSIHQSNNRTA
jgi:hypothetical protein